MNYKTIYWAAACFAACGVACGDPSGATSALDAATADADADLAADAWDGEAPDDLDQDTIPDAVDNCPGLFNPGQEDADQDGIGDPCDPEGGDRDRDGVPDVADLWPDDDQRPGTALANTVYAHTATTLFRLGVKTYAVHEVGPFVQGGGGLGEVTDIAIDRYGVMYAITFDDVFICHPQTVECWHVAPLPSAFNGMTLVPKDVLGTATDALIGVANDGGWWRLDLVNGNIQMVFLGEHGGAYTSSGDAFSIEGVGTFASVNKAGSTADYLVTLDPATGAVTGEVAAFAGYSKIWGLAGWQSQAFAFDESGAILILDLATGQVEQTLSGGQPWWGAGVRTRLDP